VAPLAIFWSISRSALWRASGVRHLVGDHEGKARLGAGDRQDARVDRDLAARQAEGVGQVPGNGAEFPLVVRRLPLTGRRMLGRVGDPPADLVGPGR
jgi:hypothetical protein